MKKSISVFGLGRMGIQIVKRLHKRGFDVVGWNRSESAVHEARRAGVFATTDIAEAVAKLPKEKRIFWLMLPHNVVDEFLFGKGGLRDFLKKGDIVVDGGNSFYKDSIRRAAALHREGVQFFDSGTSGGIWGERRGFALMVGGPAPFWPKVRPIFKALSSGDNYALLGQNGAGHFAKMVHNGIEYAMMEAIGEGYAVLEKSRFKYNLENVTRVYQKGSVIQSWLIDLTRNIFKSGGIGKTVGRIDATGEGEWTVQAAKALGVDVRVIEDALEVRRESVSPKNQKKFSNKIVALLRAQFGGHKTYKKN